MDHLLDNVHPSSELSDRVLHLQSWIMGRKRVGNRDKKGNGEGEGKKREDKRKEWSQGKKG